MVTWATGSAEQVEHHLDEETDVERWVLRLVSGRWPTRREELAERFTSLADREIRWQTTDTIAVVESHPAAMGLPPEAGRYRR